MTLKVYRSVIHEKINSANTTPASYIEGYQQLRKTRNSLHISSVTTCSNYTTERPLNLQPKTTQEFRYNCYKTRSVCPPFTVYITSPNIVIALCLLTKCKNGCDLATLNNDTPTMAFCKPLYPRTDSHILTVKMSSLSSSAAASASTGRDLSRIISGSGISIQSALFSLLMRWHDFMLINQIPWILNSAAISFKQTMYSIWICGFHSSGW